MSVFAEKLKHAGADTVGAKLTSACVEAIRRHPDNVTDAWRFVGASFGHDFVRGLMKDMHGRVPAPLLSAVSRGPGKPLRDPPERIKKRDELRKIVRSKYKNSGGIAWSDVGWHELPLLARDGKEARALLAACSANTPNDGRTVGDVLGIAAVDKIIEGVREKIYADAG